MFSCYNHFKHKNLLSLDKNREGTLCLKTYSLNEGQSYNVLHCLWWKCNIYQPCSTIYGIPLWTKLWETNNPWEAWSYTCMLWYFLMCYQALHDLDTQTFTPYKYLHLREQSCYVLHCLWWKCNIYQPLWNPSLDLYIISVPSKIMGN